MIREIYGDTKMKDCVPNLVIPAYNITKRKIELFSNRKHGEVYVRDIVDASSAAPIYYPPCKIGDDWYIDGGVSANDTSMCAFAEAIKLWGEEYPIRILAIGTGVIINPIDGELAHEKQWGPLSWFSHGDFINICLDSTIASEQAKEILGRDYLKINGILGDYDCKDDIDNYSVDNYTNLINMGEKLWEKNKRKVLKFLTRN